MKSAQSISSPSSKRGPSALSGSKAQSAVMSPAKSPAGVVDSSEMPTIQTDRLSSPSNAVVVNPAADRRAMRRIIADDPEWTLATVPDLVELTIRHIVTNFASQSLYSS